MSIKITSLGSGSAGNATLVSFDVEGMTHGILIDCGFSAREVERRLARADFPPENIQAILVTHEHGDHAKGVDVFARRFDIPVFMSEGTYFAGGFDHLAGVKWLRSGIPFMVGPVRIDPVTVAHDAREPLQFALTYLGKRVGVLTDLGSITESVVEHFSGCHALMLEANHDLQLLEIGPYPYSLKQRVGGNWGHLNNEQCRQLVEAVDKRALEHLIVGHISLKNNCLDRVKTCLAGVTANIPNVIYATQDEGFDWLCI